MRQLDGSQGFGQSAPLSSQQHDHAQLTDMRKGRAIMRRQRGFNLIELMIGLAISLMGLAAVSGVMMTFSKKRTAITQSMATQDNGVMALYRLERDISQAGYGLAPCSPAQPWSMDPIRSCPMA